MKEDKKKKIIRIIISLIIIALIITAIVFIILGFLPKDEAGHICSGDSCTIPV